MKPIRLEARIRNNILYQNIFTNYKNVAEFCRKHNLHGTEVGSLLNFTQKPKHKRTGSYKNLCIQLSKIFKLLPEDLFPDTLYYGIEKSKLAIELSYEQLSVNQRENLLLSPDLESEFIKNEENEIRKSSLKVALQTLSPRSALVLRKRFGIDEDKAMTYKEISESVGVSMERVRQIESRALRNMRHPSRRRIINARQ